MPIVSKDDEYPIIFKVPKQSFSKKFHTGDEVLAWIDAEMQFWDTLNQFPRPGRFPGLNLNALKWLTTDLLKDAYAHGAPIARLSYIEETGAMLSGGKQAKFLSNLKEREPSLYPGALIALASTLQPINERLFSQGDRGPLPWSLFMSGLGGLLKFVETDRSGIADRREIERLTSDAQILLEDIQTKSREIVALHDTQKDRLEKLGTANADLFEQTLSGHRVLFQQQLDDSEIKIADFEKLVLERLALEAPTKFWTEKAKSHRNVAIGFGMLFLAAIGGGVYWITHYGVDLVADAYQRIVGDRETPGLLALVPLAFITLPTLGFAWILRHISRIVVQNLALQADAQLRGTIANTYTALTSQNQSSPAELAIALNALFRPIDGSGHAEIAPPNIRDILEAGK